MKDLAAFSISGALWVLDSQVVPMDDEGAQINILKGKDGNQYCPWEEDDLKRKLRVGQIKKFQQSQCMSDMADLEVREMKWR